MPDLPSPAADVRTGSELDKTIAGLHTEVGELHTEVAELNVEVAELHVEVGQLPAEVKDLQAEVAHLGLALASSREISAAVGVVMERRGLSQAEAFDWLTVASQRLNLKLRHVADSIVKTGELPG